MTEEPKTEDEFLDRESRLAREALVRLRHEALESLARTADIDAWAERYPWQSLGVAAAGGLGAGWAIGRTFRRKSAPSATSGENDAAIDRSTAPPAAHRLVSGLGTLTGVVASTAFTAAAEALTAIVKDTVHNALNPQVPPEADAVPDDGGPPVEL
jgi:hypothetical protein